MIVYLAQSEYEADLLVYKADSEYDADILVYSVESVYELEDKKPELWFFADSEYTDNVVKIYYTPSQYGNLFN
jgi:hypothetical protein